MNGYQGNQDAFVVKVNGAGVLQWNTFLGGIGADFAKGIAVDAGGNVYVDGWSTVTWGSAPLQAGDRGYVAKLNGAGVLQWHTFLGDFANGLLVCGLALAADANGNIYRAGQSDSAWGSPVRAYSGAADVLVAKFNTHGTRQWHDFLGATINDTGAGIAFDGNAYISILTYGTGCHLPDCRPARIRP